MRLLPNCCPEGAPLETCVACRDLSVMAANLGPTRLGVRLADAGSW
jgi:hypothetical protein